MVFNLAILRRQNIADQSAGTSKIRLLRPMRDDDCQKKAVAAGEGATASTPGQVGAANTAKAELSNVPRAVS
jgi:hypothetical protein